MIIHACVRNKEGVERPDVYIGKIEKKNVICHPSTSVTGVTA